MADVGEKIAAAILAIALAFGLLLFLPDANEQGYIVQSETARPETCVDAETREKLRGIMLKALDDALEEQVEHLFLTWLKDDARQPERARTGVLAAIRAYLRARTGAQEWSPPTCQPG